MTRGIKVLYIYRPHSHPAPREIPIAGTSGVFSLGPHHASIPFIPREQIALSYIYNLYKNWWHFPLHSTRVNVTFLHNSREHTTSNLQTGRHFSRNVSTTLSWTVHLNIKLPWVHSLRRFLLHFFPGSIPGRPGVYTGVVNFEKNKSQTICQTWGTPRVPQVVLSLGYRKSRQSAKCFKTMQLENTPGYPMVKRPLGILGPHAGKVKIF